jgi:SagB-type dehydrogenase family enzyme
LPAWDSYGWGEAFRFHWHTNELPKIDWGAPGALASDIANMREYVSKEAPPSSFKVYDEHPLIRLAPEPPTQAISISSIFGDRSDTSETTDALCFGRFSWICQLAFAQVHTRHLPVTGDHVAKTSPSGGSRHPTEIYPVVIDVDGVEPGLYHYDVANDGIRMLRSGDFDEFLKSEVFLLRDRLQFRVRVGFIMTTVVERSMFRYRESRSYRVLNFDLGHLLQTAASLCSAASRPSLRGYTLHDSKVERFLGVDTLGEPAVSWIAIG